MVFFKGYTFLFLVLFAQAGTSAIVPAADPPMNFVHIEDHPCALSDHPNLNNNYSELSALAIKLLNSEREEPNLQLHAFGHELSRGDDPSLYWFYVVVFKLGTKHITLAVLITNEQEKCKRIFLLEYYLGFNISAFTIHKLLHKRIQAIDTANNTAKERAEIYHKLLAGMVFLDYGGAKRKWASVRSNPQGGDGAIKDNYILVRNDCSKAADKLEEKFPVLNGLKLRLSEDFVDEVQPLSGNQPNQVARTGVPAGEGQLNVQPSETTTATLKYEFTILMYLRQVLSDGSVQTGFIFDIKGEYVLGVTLLNDQINSYQSKQKPQGNANPYNVFLQKCQSLAIFLKKTTTSLQTLNAFHGKIFGRNQNIGGVRLAKFGLTVSPWTTNEIWMGLKYEFFNCVRTNMLVGVTKVESILTRREKDFSYWRSTSVHENSSWGTILELTEDIPTKPTEDLPNPDKFKTTWLDKQQKYLNSIDGQIVRNKKPEWDGIDIEWATKLPTKFPYGFLEDTSKAPLFFKKANPAVDNILLIPIKDRSGKYVIASDGKLRWKTIVGKRYRAPFKRALNGGFVELNHEVEKVLRWIGAKFPAIRTKLLKDICLLNAMKEFLEESRDIGSLDDAAQEKLWLEYVELVLLPTDDSVKIHKIFSGATGDGRNRPNSFVYVNAYAFVIYHHPKLEAFLSEENLIGGDDSVESAIVDVTNDMYCFANHGLFILRAMLYCPTREQLILVLNAIEASAGPAGCALTQENVKLLSAFIE